MRRLRDFLVLALVVASTSAAGADRKFFSGYAGTLPSDDRNLARTYFNQPPVRALLERLENGTLSVDDVRDSLVGSGVSADDLRRIGLLRSEGDRLAIGFAYFTASDMKRIYAAVDRLAPSLAAAYEKRKDEISRILERYRPRSVRRDDLAFVLLAGFCLNWDGLELTRELGYRRPILVEGKDFRYSFWASEDVPGRNYHEVYWGSSTFPLRSAGNVPPDAFSYSSFGDPDSDPRMNLPDLLYTPPADMSPDVRRAAERVGLHDCDEMGQHFQQVLGGDLLAPISRILFELRRQPASLSDLPHSPANAKAVLDLLEEIQYVAQDAHGIYSLRVPVFDLADQKLVDEMIALHRQVLRGWLVQSYPAMKRDLADLTALRSGLPFEALFTQIWHEIFGAVNQRLAGSGLISSTYRGSAKYKGSLSTLWRQRLSTFVPG